MDIWHGLVAVFVILIVIKYYAYAQTQYWYSSEYKNYMQKKQIKAMEKRRMPKDYKR